jgi:hypothetical protein
MKLEINKYRFRKKKKTKPKKKILIEINSVL